MKARLIAFYVATVGALSMLPFLALHLTDLGMSDSAAAATLMLLPGGMLLGAPIWGWVVDRSNRGRTVLVAALGASAFCVAVLLVPGPAAVTVAVLGVFAFVRAPVFPLGDALTVFHLGTSYGRIRAFGSVAYVVGIVAIGSLRDIWPPVALLMPAMLLGVAAVVARSLPEIPSTERPGLRDLLALVRDPGVLLLLGVAFFNGLAVSAYDHLFALHLERIGLGSFVAGLSVGFGVVVEVAVMFSAPWLLRRVGGPALLAVAVAAGIPRFFLTAWSAEPWVVGPVQGLHGLQFGAFWIASVDLMSRLAPMNLRRSGQALLLAMGFGLSTLCSLTASSLWLRHGDTSTVFQVLTVPCVVATVLAGILAVRANRITKAR